MRSILALSLVLGLAAAASAAQPRSPMQGPGGFHGGPPMDRSLFPPDLILSNQIALGLTDDQTASIKKMINETHQKVLDFQTALQRTTEQLHTELSAPKVNEAAAISFATQVMGFEQQIKTAHMTLLIRIKNMLTPEQQTKAAALRPADDGKTKMRRMEPDATPDE
ncbi:MAG TPA: periplasmic heavy metal sensor [Candidatus Bathyarchaeia archaeon]|nr:periplasmic heavy metal sensor [Candidatus Bathyarchaeia archaeon]